MFLSCFSRVTASKMEWWMIKSFSCFWSFTVGFISPRSSWISVVSGTSASSWDAALWCWYLKGRRYSRCEVDQITDLFISVLKSAGGNSIHKGNNSPFSDWGLKNYIQGGSNKEKKYDSSIQSRSLSPTLSLFVLVVLVRPDTWWFMVVIQTNWIQKFTAII